MFWVIYMLLIIIIAIISIVGMFFCIFKFPTLKIGDITIDTFYLPPLIGAIIIFLLPSFDKNELFSICFSNSSLNPLKILVLFICISILSIALDQTGFFSYIASIFINKYKASQIKLFVVLYILISFLTIFTSNDIVILTFTPFILYFSKRGNINPIPYLVMEFVAANTYSMILPIGNPTNIYLTSIFEIDFLAYVSKMILPALLCGIISFICVYLLFKKELKKKISIFDMEISKINNKPLCIIAFIHLALTTILLAISNYINIEMWIICFVFALSISIILIVYSIVKHNSFYIMSTIKRVPYSLIPFILSMFTIIMALDSFNIFDYIYNCINNINIAYLQKLTYLISSVLACNIINNIPMTLAYGSILSNTNNLSFVYITIIGSNIGAILTPVGALAGIMWLRILKINDINYSFKSFVKNGMIITFSIILVLMLIIIII